MNPETLRAGLSQKEGEPLDTVKLDQDLIRIRSAGDLQTIDYSVVTERDKTILRVTPVEKSLGPDYLRFGMNLYSDFRGDSSYNIRALHRRTWINSLGGEFVVAAQVGTTQALYAEFYQPLEPTQMWFVRTFANGSSSNAPLFSGGQQLAVYRTYSGKAGASGGANLGTWGQVSLGYRAENAHAAVVTGPASCRQCGSASAASPRTSTSIRSTTRSFPRRA